MVLPSTENFVNSKRIKISGNKIGKANTGYRVPFALALDIIAAMMVEETAMPKLPKIVARVKSPKFWTEKESNKSE